MRRALILPIFVALSCAGSIDRLNAQRQRPKRVDGITAGQPQVVPPERIQPVMDALLQDGAAIQFAPLLVDETAANGTSVDAIRQNLQISASFNQMDAAQNNANLRILHANADQQTGLITSLTSLQAAQSTLQNDLATKIAAQAAQKKAKASADDQAVADQAVTDAQANLKTVTDQITATSGLIKSGVTTPSFTSTTPGKDALGVTPAATNTLSNFNPAQPPTFNAKSIASRQVDDRLNALTDRALRLISLQGVTNYVANMQVRYLEVTPSIRYADKRTATIGIRYRASCATNAQPVVLDVLPRRAAINIQSEKYKDNGFSLAGFFGFSAASASAAYNRQHLQLTTALAQSAYESGFGAGTQEFGWVLGRALGEETVATGQRDFFVKMAIPTTCTGFSAMPIDVVFSNKDGKILETATLPQLKSAPITLEDATKLPKLTELAYDPVSIAANSNTSVPVYVAMTFDSEVDPQSILTVNGKVLKRARDNFTRATSTATTPGATSNQLGGLLETSSIDTGVWVPAGGRQIQVELDGRNFTGAFPRIVLSTPTGSVNLVTDALFSGTFAPTVGSSAYRCSGPNCAAALPSLATTAGGNETGVATWWGRNSFPRVVVSLYDDVVTPTPEAKAAGAVVASDDGSSAWSAAAVASLQDAAGQKWPLRNCASQGMRLVCDLPTNSLTMAAATGGSVSVNDPKHIGNKSVAVRVPLHTGGMFDVLSTASFLQSNGNEWNLTYTVYQCAFRGKELRCGTPFNRRQRGGSWRGHMPTGAR